MLREVARLLVSILDVKKTVSVASSQSGGDDPLMLESLFLLRSVLSTRDDPDQVLLTQMPPPPRRAESDGWPGAPAKLVWDAFPSISG